MKQIASLFSAVLLMATIAFGQAQMEVSSETHSFGKIPVSIPVTHKFNVKNTGTEPLIIENVQKVCGCTVTEWTKEPIMPGKSGFVTAQYNAARVGKFKKPITIISNAGNSPMKLYFEGEVVEKSELDGAPANKTGFNN